MAAEDRCSDKTWGFLATNVPDPPDCIADCRQSFLRGLSLDDETLEKVCSVLSDTGSTNYQDQPIFWSLYCCDAQLCGVDNLEIKGEDPNVNWFINSCQNIGYPSVTDSGPPEPTYTCSHVSLYGEDPLCQQHKDGSQTLTEGATGTTFYLSQTSMATSTYSSINDPSLEASLDPPSEPDDGQVEETGGLTIGVKVTIGLSVLVGLILILLAVICLLRHLSRRPNRRSFRQLLKYKYHTSPPLPTDSPTPLFSPIISHPGPDGVPLTPPPPLRERRLLDVGINSRPSSAGGPRIRAGFPASPVFAPTMSKLLPRSERTPRMNGLGTSPPMSPLGWTMAQDGSLRSFSSNPTSTISSAWTNASAATVASRAALSRTFDIPGLASPGPPPNRALPSTPPNGIALPSATASPIRHGDIGVAIGVVSQNPADGVILNQESRDLCDLTEACSRESRDNSWGSWRGSGGGVTMSPRKGRDVGSPVLQEGDLERMAGRY